MPTKLKGAEAVEAFRQGAAGQVVLVLQGGGALGAYQVGVYQALHEAGVEPDWVNCGLCVDERGATEVVAGVRRGSPADFWKMATETANTVVIPTR